MPFLCPGFMVCWLLLSDGCVTGAGPSCSAGKSCYHDCRGWAAVWVGLGHIRTWMCLCWELAQSMDAFKLRYIYYNEGENGWLLHLFVFCKTTYQIRNNKHSYETVEDKVGLYRKMRKGKIIWWEQKQFIHSGFMLLRLVIAVLWHVSDWQQMSSSTKIISISWKSNIPFK